MAGLLYFVPGAAGQLTLEQLRAAGLGQAFDSNPFCRAVSGETPSGTPGLVVGDRRRMGDHPVKLLTAEQTWRKLPGLEAHVGWYDAAPPTPADLVRPRTINSLSWPFADLNDWMIPLVRICDAAGECRCLLPTRYDLDDAGQLVAGDIIETYRWLWELTEPFWQAMVGEEEIDDQACLECAGALLRTNYYLDWREAGRLGLFGLEFGPAAMVALAVGAPTWKRWVDSKKKTPSPPCSTPPDNATPAGVTD